MEVRISTRPHIEFVQAGNLLKRKVTKGSLAGAFARELSRAEADGSYTVLLTVPPDWSSLQGFDRPYEFYVVRGDLTVDGHRSGPGFYSYVPGSKAASAISSDAGALVLLFVRGERDDVGEIHIVDTDRMMWQNPAAHQDAGAGIVVKPLRLDDETGDSTWLAGLAPGWFLTEAETHPVEQEVFMLQGDVYLPGHGAFTAGSYFWRPPYIHHGPLISRSGALILMRSFTSDMTVEWHAAPGYEEQHADYVAQFPLLADL